MKILALSLAIALMPAATMLAQGNRSGIAGTVRDNLGHPVPQARVLVDGSKVSSVSDDSGRFDVRGLPAGTNGFTFTKIGFAPVSFETKLLPDSVIVVEIRLRAVQVLNTVDINAARTNAVLARVGFVDRRKLGLGTFMTPEHLDSMAQVVTRPSMLFRDVRGVDVRCGPAHCTVLARNSPTCLWLYIDGVPHGTEQIDEVGLTQNVIAAIEVYERASIVPSEFQGALPQKQGRGMSMAGGCGAIAVWTKARIP